MRRVHDLIRRAAGVRATTLILGESGTGKELVARALHELSPWRRRPFVAVNCGAIPDALLESELFGHVRGAFTDAARDRQGLLEAAGDGTFFLDEIGELGLPLQVKLLRLLQEGEYRRVGETELRRTSVRIVTATNRNLEAEVEAGRFREDLYYRLTVLVIDVPPLRGRGDDVLLLAERFMSAVAERYDRPRTTIANDARELLRSYPWPGNVRELENEIERALILSPPGAQLSACMFSTKVQYGISMPRASRGDSLCHDAPLLRVATEQVEKRLIQDALVRHDGNRTRTARSLGLSRQGLLKKLRRLQLVPSSPSRSNLPRGAARDTRDRSNGRQATLTHTNGAET
jgi:transcriptional regulator with PAS, ATPase and Fis domain